jgi:hypothetical protein
MNFGLFFLLSIVRLLLNPGVTRNAVKSSCIWHMAPAVRRPKSGVGRPRASMSGLVKFRALPFLAISYSRAHLKRPTGEPQPARSRLNLKLGAEFAARNARDEKGPIATASQHRCALGTSHPMIIIMTRPVTPSQPGRLQGPGAQARSR